jgi:hypothetical protein
MKDFNKLHVSAIVCLLLASALILCSLPDPAAGKNINPGILPPQSAAFGMSYGEWGAAWNRWMISFPADTNPVLDQTGEDALLGQQGHVFFLAGTFGGTVVRTVTVPTGKALFFPLANWGLTYPEDVPAELNAEEGETWMRQLLNDTFDNLDISSLGCEVDGVPINNIKSYRAQSAAYAMDFPAGCASVTGALGLSNRPGGGVPYEVGMHYPNVSDGYWIMLAPLSKGTHTIHIFWGDYLDVTYHLTVGSEKK